MLLQNHSYAISVVIPKYITKASYDFHYECYYKVTHMLFRNSYESYYGGNFFQTFISKIKKMFFF